MLCSAPKKLVVGTSPRTGSTLLVDSLWQHPEIVSAHEIFNPRVGDRPEGWNLCKVHSVNVDDPQFWELLCDRGVTVLFLYREDIDRQLWSWGHALETGRWVMERDDLRIKFEMPPRQWMLEMIELAEKVFRPRASMVLSYEKMVGNWDATVEKVLDLGNWSRTVLPMARRRMVYDDTLERA